VPCLPGVIQEEGPKKRKEGEIPRSLPQRPSPGPAGATLLGTPTQVYGRSGAKICFGCGVNKASGLPRKTRDDLSYSGQSRGELQTYRA
jgi:hypothetical protein